MDYASNIRHLYYELRMRRGYDSAGRRRLYRRIAFQKKLLIDSGFDPELVRLYCRYFASCDPAALERYKAYVKHIGYAL